MGKNKWKILLFSCENTCGAREEIFFVQIFKLQTTGDIDMFLGKFVLNLQLIFPFNQISLYAVAFNSFLHGR